MIPLIEREVCERHHWAEKEEVIDLLAVSQSIPGAIAINTVTFLGMTLRGFPGALVSLAGMVIPSFLIILTVASVLYRYIDLPIVANAFGGIRAAVVALIAYAVYPIAKAGIKDIPTALAALFALLSVVVFNMHAAIAILFGAAFGFLRYLISLKRITKDRHDSKSE